MKAIFALALKVAIPTPEAFALAYMVEHSWIQSVLAVSNKPLFFNPAIHRRSYFRAYWPAIKAFVGKGRNTPKVISSLGFLFLCCIAGGCSAGTVIDPSQPATDSIYSASVPFGQTFMVEHRGLQGIEIVLEGSSEPQVAQTYLFLHPEGDLVAEGTLVEGAFTGRRWVSLAWPGISVAAPRAYKLEIHPPADHALRVGQGFPDTYVDGSFYFEGEPVAAQLTFRTKYSRIALAGELLEWLWAQMQIVFVAFLVFLLPGWGLLAWLRQPPEGDLLYGWPARLCLASGLGIAFYPLLFSWMDLLGLHLGAGTLAIAAAFALLSLLIRTLLLWRDPGPSGLPSLTICRITHHADYGFLIVLAALLLSRFWPLRGVEAPFWGDSVQHAYIVQLMLDNGGLFHDWRPYADFLSFTHQFGFHANTAIYGSVRGLSGVQATLESGQILNVMGIMTLYPLAVHVAGGNRWAGVAAMVVGGLLSLQPAMYFNWGRYAQLSGMVVLPVSILLLWRMVDQRGWQPHAVIVNGIALAGMALCYYRMPLFYGAFAFLCLLFWILPLWGWDSLRWKIGLANLGGVLALGLFLLTPHLSRVTGSSLVGRAAASLQGAPRNWVWSDYQIWRSLPDYYPVWMQQWSAGALLWSFIVSHRRGFLLGLWGVSLGSLVALSLLRIPLMSELQNFAVVIAMYLPISIMSGWTVGWLLDWLNVNLEGVWKRLLPHFSVAVSLTVVVFALSPTRYIADEQYNMVTAPDMLALDWIGQNLDQDAKVFVPGFRIYGGRTVVGADAGWWIPLLGNRANSMPPQYALLERPLEKDQVNELVGLVASLEGIPLSTLPGAALLCEQGYTHVYLGQKQGAVGFEVRQLYSQVQLSQNPAFLPVYAQDRVRIYEVDPEFCASGTEFFTSAVGHMFQ